MEAQEKWTLLNANGDSTQSDGSSSENSDFVKIDANIDNQTDASTPSTENSDFIKVVSDDVEEEEEEEADLRYAAVEAGAPTRQRSPDQCSLSSIEILDHETDEFNPFPAVISSSSIEGVSEDEIPQLVKKKLSPSLVRRAPSFDETCSEAEDDVQRPTKAFPSFARLRCSEDSSVSDYSDFVRLDRDMEEGDTPSPSNSFCLDRFAYPHDRARAKMARLQMLAAKRRYSTREDDVDSIPSDVDDRCESDISGVASYDSDLSHRSIGDVPIEPGARSYKHRPNASLNTLLTMFSLMALFGAVGVGIGHYIGSVREMNLRQAQIAKMRSLQDDVVVCHQDQEKLRLRLRKPSAREMKLSTAVDIWQQKYEELVLEKADLVNKIKMMEVSLGDGLKETNRQMQEYQEEAALIGEELVQLRAETSLNESTVAENSLPLQLADARMEIRRLRLRLTTKQSERSEQLARLINENSRLKSVLLQHADTKEESTNEDRVSEESKVEQVISGTKRRIAEMLDRIQITVQKVKAASKNVFKEDDLKSVGKSLTDNVSRLGKTIKNAWKKVGTDEETNFHRIIENTKDGIARVYQQIKTTLNQDKKDVKKSLKENVSHLGKTLKKAWKNLSGYQSKDYGSIRETAHGKRDAERFYGDAFSHGASSGILHSVRDEDFERKPDHKQKQATDAYSEFWKQADFAPEEFLPDGFFEGNQREWKKHQKRFNKMHGRLRHLNAEILLDMEDDDLDDFYDDLDDLQDDLEDEVDVPEQLMTWLTCQMRWWKSRIHRKNASENPLMGCGRNLMKWQLHVSCDSTDCAPHEAYLNQTVADEEDRSAWVFQRAEERDVLRDLAWPLRRDDGRRDLRSDHD
ncbi:hypothetical protein CAPTEDRAFT_216524 [Capitella teleta]|uniref:Uncharacterized protein n=1 Tax=Capitella teleta TaxID=283909 RepID=R7UKV7_CAPTE|nr:hypothetical protein CAPTEDRAFT_216524 [Capitella teleta]|eukprot:ELU07159.1 hypothetical protein CAPTEDRAFT_216524 [Capitella teleta]